MLARGLLGPRGRWSFKATLRTSDGVGDGCAAARVEMLEISGAERLQLCGRHTGTQRPAPMHAGAAATPIHMTDGHHDSLAKLTVEPARVGMSKEGTTEQNVRDVVCGFAG